MNQEVLAISPVADRVSRPTPANEKNGGLRSTFLVAAAIALAVVCIYSRSFGFGFVVYDDRDYVVENPHVNGGLVRGNLAWAFTAIHASNWHPLTWISHMLDCEMFGLNASGHHVVNVAIHAVNAVILFLLLRRWTGEFWPSALAAALWAVHPLRVESVAWIAERKDVLSGLLFLLALGAYTAYSRKPGVIRYLSVAALFALGLLAKPMLVTFPFVALLLDFWPLRRLKLAGGNLAIRRAIVEKLPLLAMSAASVAATLSAQKGAMQALTLTLEQQLANAVVSYVVYIVQLLLPVGLAALYPHPEGSLPGAEVIAAAAFLLVVTFAAVRARRAAPHLTVGWFWYLGMLVPVIGIVQVGAQGHADRYTYLPHIGLMIALVWGLRSWLIPSPWTVAMAVGTLAILAALSWRQVGTWRDPITLMKHALRQTDRNAAAHNALGEALNLEGRNEEAIEQYRKSIEINPNNSAVYNNLGVDLQRLNRNDEAIDCYTKAIEISPHSELAFFNRGNLLAKLGRIDEAIANYSLALENCPGFSAGRTKLAALCFERGKELTRAGQLEEAVVNLRKAVWAEPATPLPHFVLGIALKDLGQFDEALECLRRAAALEPGNILYQRNFEILRRKIAALNH